MTSKRKSALDEISKFLKPAPELGSDDELDFETRAKVVEYDDEFYDDRKTRPPTIKQNVAIDDDPRYVGKRISRKNAGVTEVSDSESPVEIESEASETGTDSEDGKTPRTEQESDADEGDDSDTNESEDYGSEDLEGTNESENEDPATERSKAGALNPKEKTEGIVMFQESGLESKVEKGKAVKNQLNMWENLLECRIHLQKCLIPANRLPKYNMMEEFKKEGGSEFTSELSKIEKSVKKMLDKFVVLQETLIGGYSETRNLGQKRSSERGNLDEEILSDSDEEITEHVTKTPEICQPKAKKRRFEEYSGLLASVHEQYTEFRDATIQKWNDRTRISSGKNSSRDFSAFEQGTLQQIRHVLSNRTRLIKRTQLPRSMESILGEPEQKDNSTQSEHDPEIFDDSDFYHQLLRELIERRTDDSQDSAALGRKWATLQKLRTKMKRRVDTRATKGRRLRYDPHQKLVGFMAPVVSSSVWNDKAAAELFSSLFGKTSVG